MLPLAAWLMQGRSRTIGFTMVMVAISPVVWIGAILGAAALSLVWLRMGEKQGVMVGLWALLPALLLAGYEGIYLPALLLVSGCLASWILRKSSSWQFSLMGIAASGLAGAAGLEKLAAPSLAPYAEGLEKALDVLRQQLAQTEVQAILPDSVETVFVAGMFGALLVMGTFTSVALARYWQAGLYNPGGFRKEFHRLRLGRVMTAALVVGAISCFTLGSQYLAWAWIVFFPLLVAGVALFHGLAPHWGLATHWYVLFYVLLVLWDPLKVFLAGLAIADSFLDFRARLPEKGIDEKK